MTEWPVTLSASAGVLVTSIATVTDWLDRGAGAHTIEVTIDGDTLESSSVTPAEQAEQIQNLVDCPQLT